MNEELKIIISAEITKLKSAVNEAKGVISTFKSEINKSKDVLEKSWKTIGEGATKASKVIIGGIAGIGTALVGSAAMTTDYRNVMAKLNTAFEAAGSSADVAKQTYNDLYRVMGDSDTAVEAANHLAKLTTNEQDLAEWTNICQGVYATFGDSLPIEGLTEAANETAKVGKVTGPLADALNWAGVSEDAFNESLAACADEQEREALIRETLNGLYDDAANKFETNNANVIAQNEAQAKLTDTMAKLGATVAPVVTLFTEFATQALSAVEPYIQQLAEEYGPQLKDILANIGEFLAPIAEFVMNNLPMIATIAGIILGIAAAYQVITAALAAYNAIKTVYTAVTTIATAAQTAFAAANIAALAPILLVVAAIAAVIAIIVICIKHWDEIKEAVGKAWDFIKEKTQEAVNAVVQWFTDLKEKISEKIQAVKDIVAEKFEAIKQAMSEKIQAAKEIVSTVFDGIKNSIQNKINTAKNIISNVLAAIKAIFSGDFGAAKESVLNIFNAIKDGIKNKIDNARDTVKNAIDKIKGFFNFSWSLPKLKLPHISISGKFSLAPLSVPKFSISWNALGGVFDKPTLFNFGDSLQGLGENGAEAVVPLEKNLGWLNKLADMLSERLGSNSNTPIVLQVDGTTFAQTSIRSINQLTKQTGSLGLNLV